ncbi:hypothetical protein EHS13_33550 [Paenibacillus psychroresistens]|uniref:DUF4367 domain-containing protein n=1 Tax=Paenibacillus psychroresistens TaxID=1778678 RepID=A0A6B8RWG3_9BACL|nr:hypothetical protein [Paenibacillus psychroresistens]QGQ99438.1 hypothetical protein EHS13_33550 [Paenibacillus psychroresistens]
MNNNSNYDQLIDTMKSIQLPRIDTAPPVMERIRLYEASKGTQIRRSYRLRLIWAAVVVLLLVTSLSVSAAIHFTSFDWNGIQIAFYSNNNENIIYTNEMKKSDIKRIEHELLDHEKWKEVTLAEAKNLFPWPFLRLDPKIKSPTRTFGVLRVESNSLKSGSIDELPLDINGFYDFFEQGKQWIVARQVLYLSDLLKVQNSMIQKYPESSEVVKVDDSLMSIYSSNKFSKVLILRIKIDENTLISLEVSGNVSKKELFQIAEGYVGKPLK